MAESQRVLSTVYRRAGRPEYALDICTAAVEQLRQLGGFGHEMRAAEMLCSAAYCAVSVGTALGDPGAALTAIGTVNIAALTSTERQARFLVDAAAARLAADQPERAAHTLVVAARIAPQAVASRPGAAVLAGQLRQARPGLHRTLDAAGL